MCVILMINLIINLLGSLKLPCNVPVFSFHTEPEPHPMMIKRRWDRVWLLTGWNEKPVATSDETENPSPDLGFTPHLYPHLVLFVIVLIVAICGSRGFVIFVLRVCRVCLIVFFL